MANSRGSNPMTPPDTPMRTRRRLLVWSAAATAAGLVGLRSSRPTLPRAPTHRAQIGPEPRWVEATTDEIEFADGAASFTKTLPHSDDGLVSPDAYRLYLEALRHGTSEAFEALPMGGSNRLVNPLGAYQESTVGSLPAFGLPSPPSIRSREAGVEMIELYWLQLLRDVAFVDYETDPVVAAARTELNTIGFSSSLLSLSAPGPFVSQFLYLDVPYGWTWMGQKGVWATPSMDFMSDPSEFLRSQRGVKPNETLIPASGPTYIRTGRDLACWVAADFSYQVGLGAALILLKLGREALASSNPYRDSRAQDGFATFGSPMVLSLVARASQMALDAAWHQKWRIHRRIRPEALAARIQATLRGQLEFPVHSVAINSAALGRVQSSQGTFHLSQAYPDGAPAHPSYPSGHAAMVGAQVTVLKAFFDDRFVLPWSVQPSRDGRALENYRGALAVGDELDKLAFNVAVGRQFAGIHYSSDCAWGLQLGEAVALQVLHEVAQTVPEAFGGFRLRSFDGKSLYVA